MEPLHVTGLGLASALGRDAISSCAAARAGLMRLAELGCIDAAAEQSFGSEPLCGHAISPELDGFSGVGRTLLLAQLGLADLLRDEAVAKTLAEHRCGAVLNLSDHLHEDQAARGADHALDESDVLPSASWQAATADLLPRLCERSMLPIAQEDQLVVWGGRTGLLAALRAAEAKLGSGEWTLAVVGCADSLVYPERLWALQDCGLLKSGASPVGLIPGEAAGFLALSAADTLPRSGACSRGCIDGAGEAVESTTRFDEDASSGDALRDALLQAWGEEAEPVELYADLNGDVRRAAEWGTVQVRDAGVRALAQRPTHYPIVAFGDTGAAAGMVSLALAIRAMERGYAQSPASLLWSAADDGRRMALRLRGAAKG